MIEAIKERWAVFTLVDITNTGVTRGSGKARNQQRNYETLIQTVSLLSQPWTIHDVEILDNTDIPDILKFGDKHTFITTMFGVRKVWYWQFGIEQREVFGTNGEILLEYLHNVPVITGLDEDTLLDLAVFNTSPRESNILLFRAG